MADLRSDDADSFDIVVIGDDLAACLLSLALQVQTPSSRLALLSANAEIGGEWLELVLPERLSPSFAELLGPITIREWSTCAVRANQETVIIDERVCLIDPVQVWLELSQHAGIAPFAGCRDLALDGGVLCWSGRRIAAASLIDLRSTSRFPRSAEIVEAGMFSDLWCPVIADYDAAGVHWRYLQYVPLGSDRALINRVGWHSADRPSPCDDLGELPTVAPLAIAAAAFDERRPAVAAEPFI